LNAVDGLVLLVIAVNLTVAGSLDVAVRDVVMAIAAWPVSEIHHTRGISARLAAAGLQRMSAAPGYGLCLRGSGRVWQSERQ
jgi:hypothetical protein